VRRGIIIAWLVGEGIISYKSVKKNDRPPLPADLLAASGAFVLLGILSEFQDQLAMMLAVGLDAAALLTLFPTSKTSPSVSNAAAGVGNAAANSASATVSQ
jgi:hypothetical protein